MGRLYLFLNLLLALQLLARPVDYGLSASVGSEAEDNLRVVATLFNCVLRRIYTQLQQPTPTRRRISTVRSDVTLAACIQLTSSVPLLVYGWR